MPALHSKFTRALQSAVFGNTELTGATAQASGFGGPAPANGLATATQPPFDPSDFVSGVNNEYFPLQPGTTYVYEGDTAEGHEVNRFTVTNKTVKIAGVDCVEVVDIAYLDGEVVERTRDWFAQDKDGNVWYFGEFSQEIENGEVLNINGTWKAGVNGAMPGIIMKAEPETGDTYYQEFAPGIAEDKATVLGDEFRTNTVYGKFAEVLKTKDFTPLEPGKFEHKFYAEGVGQILTINPLTGDRHDLVRIEFNGGAGNDTIAGKSGRDVIRGNDGADTLSGLDGNDIVLGGKGNDVLKGGRGDDRMTGGLGGDRFVFTGLNDGTETTDTITDYHRSEGDRLDLGTARAGAVEGQIFLDGAWQLMLKGDGDVIRLIGVTDANHNGRIVDDLLFV